MNERKGDAHFPPKRTVSNFPDDNVKPWNFDLRLAICFSPIVDFYDLKFASRVYLYLDIFFLSLSVYCFLQKLSPKVSQSIARERESTCQKWRCSDKWGTITNWHKLKFQISEMKKNSYKFLKFKFGFK